MKKILFYIGFFLTLVVLIIMGIFYNTNKEEALSDYNDSLKGVLITVYKSESCMCCNEYIAILRKNGARVNVISDDIKLQKIKQIYGIAPSKQSCHTSVIDKYFVEGHVPIEVIVKFLSEKPDVYGITLPGMPSGTPGMPGIKSSKFKIEAKTKNGNYKVYMIY